MSDDKADRSRSVSLPVRMPIDLVDRIDQAAAEVKLSRQAVIRLSVDRGLDVLVKQMLTRPAVTEPTISA